MEEIAQITSDGWVRIEQPLEGYIYVRPSMVASVMFDISSGAIINLFNSTSYKIAEDPQTVVERLEDGAKRERKAARP